MRDANAHCASQSVWQLVYLTVKSCITFVFIEKLQLVTENSIALLHLLLSLCDYTLCFQDCVTACNCICIHYTEEQRMHLVFAE